MASLPKPLSQKSIQKMLARWKPETVNKLHAYYAAFSNLYGVIMLNDAWKIMKQYEPKIRKNEFMDFSSITRRENLPYYIIEIDPMTYLSHALEETDTKLTMAEYEKLLQLWQDANNYSHHWANRGWTPIALRQRYGNPAPRTMSFGLGLQQAFAKGDIDKNELIEKFKSMGISMEE